MRINQLTFLIKLVHNFYRINTFQWKTKESILELSTNVYNNFTN